MGGVLRVCQVAQGPLTPPSSSLSPSPTREVPPTTLLSSLPDHWTCADPPCEKGCDAPEDQAGGEEEDDGEQVVCRASDEGTETFGLYFPSEGVVRCQCGCNSTMRPTQFAKHARNRSRRPADSIFYVRSGAKIGERGGGSKPKQSPAAPTPRVSKVKLDPWLEQAVYDTQAPQVGSTFTVYQHVFDAAKPALFPTKGFSRHPPTTSARTPAITFHTRFLQRSAAVKEVGPEALAGTRRRKTGRTGSAKTALPRDLASITVLPILPEYPC